jgi:hypothetical protein
MAKACVHQQWFGLEHKLAVPWSRVLQQGFSPHVEHSRLVENIWPTRVHARIGRDQSHTHTGFYASHSPHDRIQSSPSARSARLLHRQHLIRCWSASNRGKPWEGPVVHILVFFSMLIYVYQASYASGAAE